MDERDRQIVTLTLQGYSVKQISEQIGRTERTVQRVLERIRLDLMSRCESDDSGVLSEN